MSGKFNHISNGIVMLYVFIVALAVIFGGGAVLVKAGLQLGAATFIVIILLVIACLPIIPLRKCAFSADDEKVVFRVLFIKHTYSFSEIHSASTQVGFSRVGYGSSAHMELVITLSDGECFKFYDDVVPDEALSTPENHKKFRDTHPFTALCKYINERASGNA